MLATVKHYISLNKLPWCYALAIIYGYQRTYGGFSSHTWGTPKSSKSLIVYINKPTIFFGSPNWLENPPPYNCLTLVVDYHSLWLTIINGHDYLVSMIGDHDFWTNHYWLSLSLPLSLLMKLMIINIGHYYYCQKIMIIITSHDMIGYDWLMGAMSPGSGKPHRRTKQRTADKGKVSGTELARWCKLNTLHYVYKHVCIKIYDRYWQILTKFDKYWQILTNLNNINIYIYRVYMCITIMEILADLLRRITPIEGDT